MPMTDQERSIEGYRLFQLIQKKLAAGAVFKVIKSAEFFNDQIPRFNRRYENTYVSIGQLKWLSDIIAKRQLTKGGKSK
jgi:hypothetical protein